MIMKPITNSNICDVEDFFLDLLPDEFVTTTTLSNYSEDTDEGRVYYDENENIIGAVVIGTCNVELEILYIASVGFGRRIMSDIEDLCKEIGVKYIKLCSKDSAVGFYKKMGFEKDPDTRGDFIKYL